MNNYSTYKTELISCLHIVPIGIFLFLSGLSIAGTISAFAIYLPNWPIVGGQVLQEELQQVSSMVDSVTEETAANTTAGMIAANSSDNNNGNSTSDTGRNISTTQNQSRYQEAIEYYDRALGVDPNNTDALYN